ncbi:unnamed protein product [Chondrus crispus]|uniref:Uncharacterized protein n=1 Tax=Chondrus crispus TaxID=2769 RepID=R7QS25_CHOCR|nr:unnamed protein product [Chondrus crispus]CDF40924.1 unnamed protein product [Chondrus crispus]|eukprot:XP_005711218.1 unnamed protein product [Chondrus crispus]
MFGSYRRPEHITPSSPDRLDGRAYLLNTIVKAVGFLLITFLFHPPRYSFHKMFPCIMAEFIFQQVRRPFVIFNPSDTCQLL